MRKFALFDQGLIKPYLIKVYDVSIFVIQRNPTVSLEKPHPENIVTIHNTQLVMKLLYKTQVQHVLILTF